MTHQFLHPGTNFKIQNTNILRVVSLYPKYKINSGKKRFCGYLLARIGIYKGNAAV
jgi:hypothetical protein